MSDFAVPTDGPATESGSPVPTAASDRLVPRLCAFYGIVVWMYLPDPPPPHFHAQYAEHLAQIELETLRVLNRSLTPRALHLIRQWARVDPQALTDNWERAVGLEPLLPIEPLA